MNDPLHLLKRYSSPAKILDEPAPDDTQLKMILETALYAPDHGRLYPYRFIIIRGDARYRLSEVFGSAVKKRDPQVSDEYFKKQMYKPLRSPLIVVVVDRRGGRLSHRVAQGTEDRAVAERRYCRAFNITRQ
jgi:nitroreductase